MRGETIYLNLFGGPGTGKSTTAAGIFSLLKLSGVDCELVTEFAKELVWEKREHTMKDQNYIFSKQRHKLWRLHNVVEVVVTDSPLMLSILYKPNDVPGCFDDYVLQNIKQFNNLNFFLERTKKFNPNGRLQTEEESKLLDKRIKEIMINNNTKFHIVKGNYQAINEITDHVLLKLDKRRPLDYMVVKTNMIS